MRENRKIIHLPARFTFDARSQFRAAYVDQPVPAGGYEVDFQSTEFIDTAGLGMLLQLVDYAGERELVRLKHLKPELRQLLRLAEVDSHLTVEAAGSQ